MREEILIAVVVAITALSGVLGTLLGVKMTNKFPAIVIGWRKKNRVVLRDERLMPVYVKTRLWGVWAMLDIITMLVLAGYESSYGNWSFVLWILIVGGIIAVGLIAMWRIRLASFHKLRNEMGVELERDEETVKNVIGDVRKEVNPFERRLCICGAVLFTVISVAQFMQGQIFLGVLLAVCSTYFIVYTIVKLVKSRRDTDK